MDKGGKLKKAWHFFWHEDSLASFAVNIGVALLVIIYVVYPLLGMVLGTSFPIVAVISESMQHGLHNGKLCDAYFVEFKESFDNYWDVCGSWYEEQGISKERFKSFPFAQGFNKGDVIVLWRANKDNLEVGDILVFQNDRPQPIIHRMVQIEEEDGKSFYHTKGDHNRGSIAGEEKIDQGRIYGKGLFRVPYLGWVKILFVELVRPLGWNIQR
ncbi:MAG: signal peptidase I [Nanoarchaeota archaeon]|nr:signal peptidase I [Nanoarchaeota archaeon]